MKNKVFIISGLFCAMIIFVAFFVFINKDDFQMAPIEEIKISKIKIAVCPTCLELAHKLDKEKYQIIATASTAESIQFVQTGKADLILAGRTLKPSEPKMETLVVADGYSFIGNQEKTLYFSDLKNEKFFTDLDIEKIKFDFNIHNIEQVENVYQYLDKGIVITSWENTDYSRASIIHILENNGNRVKLSRRPAVYCLHTCGVVAEEIALSLNNH